MRLCSWRIFHYCHLRQCRSGQFTDNPTFQARAPLSVVEAVEFVQLLLSY
jgi:hypothetical protein